MSTAVDENQSQKKRISQFKNQWKVCFTNFQNLFTKINDQARNLSAQKRMYKNFQTEVKKRAKDSQAFEQTQKFLLREKLTSKKAFLKALKEQCQKVRDFTFGALHIFVGLNFYKDILQEIYPSQADIEKNQKLLAKFLKDNEGYPFPYVEDKINKSQQNHNSKTQQEIEEDKEQRQIFAANQNQLQQELFNMNEIPHSNDNSNLELKHTQLYDENTLNNIQGATKKILGSHSYGLNLQSKQQSNFTQFDKVSGFQHSEFDFSDLKSEKQKSELKDVINLKISNNNNEQQQQQPQIKIKCELTLQQNDNSLNTIKWTQQIIEQLTKTLNQQQQQQLPAQSSQPQQQTIKIIENCIKDDDFEEEEEQQQFQILTNKKMHNTNNSNFYDNLEPQHQINNFQMNNNGYDITIFKRQENSCQQSECIWNDESDYICNQFDQSDDKYCQQFLADENDKKIAVYSRKSSYDFAKFTPTTIAANQEDIQAIEERQEEEENSEQDLQLEFEEVKFDEEISQQQQQQKLEVNQDLSSRKNSYFLLE